MILIERLSLISTGTCTMFLVKTHNTIVLVKKVVLSDTDLLCPIMTEKLLTGMLSHKSQ